jgi:hypothetical protein
MGASIEFVIEYDDSDRPPFESDIDGVIDFTKSFDIKYSKPYDLMQAIAGIRGEKKLPPKISPRGFPKNMQYQNKKYYEEIYGLDYKYAGWLTYQEVVECLMSAGIKIEELNEAIFRMVDILKQLSDKLGDSRARLIFAIST